uniref:Uncharacterized protein n=1 Tax=Medicago truncatula TaxID=3880 RepID=I3T737_MEDTR|nr:unknown [Medicago truncatula]
MPLRTRLLHFAPTSSNSYGSIPQASVSSSTNKLDTTEQESGPTCKTLCMLSPYAFFKMGNACSSSNVHDEAPSSLLRSLISLLAPPELL